MSDQARYEELAALAEAGELGDEELGDLQGHAESCAQCKETAQGELESKYRGYTTVLEAFHGAVPPPESAMYPPGHSSRTGDRWPALWPANDQNFVLIATKPASASVSSPL